MTSRATPRRTQGTATNRPPRFTGNRYLTQSERPWASLLFLLPLIVAYELYAAGLIGQDPPRAVRTDIHITAFLLLEGFFRLLGQAGRHLPAVTLVGLLLGWQIYRRYPWHIGFKTLPAMAVESVAWSVPMLVVGAAAAHYLPLASSTGVPAWVILCLGAGIYEEMVFRLIAVTVLIWVIRDAFAVPSRAAVACTLLLSGVLFALYHYLSPGETFQLKSFVFRTVAGTYFGALYWLRGFGVTAASHAAYDLIVVGLLAT